jgi:hypothetical protein
MPVLRLNVPLETDRPVLEVENRLRPGPHVFRLVVEDDDGLRSDPSDRVVTVTDNP